MTFCTFPWYFIPFYTILYHTILHILCHFIPFYAIDQAGSVHFLHVVKAQIVGSSRQRLWPHPTTLPAASYWPAGNTQLTCKTRYNITSIIQPALKQISALSKLNFMSPIFLNNVLKANCKNFIYSNLSAIQTNCMSLA